MTLQSSSTCLYCGHRITFEGAGWTHAYNEYHQHPATPID